MIKYSEVFYPHDEATTYLLPATIGCSYNKCIFCGMYKDVEYSIVPFDEIEMILMNGYEYTEKVFLTGADPLSMGFERMSKLLDIINKHLKYCACVSCYASIKNISRYSMDELSILHEKGIRMLYIGFETGSDEILRLMKKGHTSVEAVNQAKRLNQANIQFNTVVMYGIAGKGKGLKNAVDTASMIDQFVTSRIITMNLTVFEGTGLSRIMKEGLFTPASNHERLQELRLLLEMLDPKNHTIFDTTHPTNLVKIKGILPYDKKLLINNICI